MSVQYNGGYHECSGRYHEYTGGPGGAHVKILTGMLVLFFWVRNLAKSYFSGLANFLTIFLGFAKFPLFFWV